MKPKTPEQLNRLNMEAATIAGLQPHPDISGANDLYLMNPETKELFTIGTRVGLVTLWNPCDKNSAQAQNYLIPMLRKLCDVQIQYDYSPVTDNVCWRFEICRKDCQIHDWAQLRWEETGMCLNDDINACIVECFIEAMNKLNAATEEGKAEVNK